MFVAGDVPARQRAHMFYLNYNAQPDLRTAEATKNALAGLKEYQQYVLNPARPNRYQLYQMCELLVRLGYKSGKEVRELGCAAVPDLTRFAVTFPHTVKKGEIAANNARVLMLLEELKMATRIPVENNLPEPGVPFVACINCSHVLQLRTDLPHEHRKGGNLLSCWAMIAVSSTYSKRSRLYTNVDKVRDWIYAAYPFINPARTPAHTPLHEMDHPQIKGCFWRSLQAGEAGEDGGDAAMDQDD
jgi:hypothetical protein